jgi:hypothetical protein
MKTRILVSTACCLLGGAGTANAALVYQRAGNAKIVVAHDDGSHRHVIAEGAQPKISPDGRWVVYAKQRGSDFDLVVVKTRGGTARRLMRHYAACTCSPSVPGLGTAWSPDSRHVVAQDASNGIVELIDVADGSKRDLPFDAGRPSFSPDATRIAGPYGEPGLAVYNIKHRTLKRVSSVGDAPAWGHGGLAFATEHGISVKRKLDEPGRLVKPRTSDESFRFAVDWTAAGGKLLAATGPSQFSLKAFVISPSSGQVLRLPATFSEVDALSRRGHWVLGATSGDVVAMAPDGKTRVLAHHAQSPSWTK